MKATPTKIPDVLLVEPDVFDDERGFFMVTWRRDTFAGIGVDCEFVQDNHSRSSQGTLRGLHYQIKQPQGKLVRVSAGEIYDVAVDLRRSSATFGQWVGHHLSADNRHMVFIPPGFGHGFYVMSEAAEVQYRCTDYYAPDYERRIRWNDPELAIDWPLQGPPLLSHKDGHEAQSLARAECYP